MQQQAAYQAVRKPLLVMQDRANGWSGRGHDGSNSKELAAVQAAIEELLSKNELNGPVYEDLLRLKGLHARLLHRRAPRSGFFG